MFKSFNSCLLTLLSSILIATGAQAQGNFDKVEIKTFTVADNIYMLEGAGGNIGVFIGDDGTFLIDDQYAPLTDKIIAAIGKLTDQPIQFLVNTHWHGDHTGGNENLGDRGVLIAAHDNVFKRMSEAQYNPLFKATTPPAAKNAQPKISFSDNMSFHINGEHLKVLHVANAHTDGDSMVQFSKSNVIHTGDVFFSGAYPFIDTASGGSVMGYIAAVEKLLSLVDGKTKIIPGHGPLSSKKELQAYYLVLTTARDRIQKLIDDGKSLEEVQALKPLAEYDESYGHGFIKAPMFLTIVYNDLNG